MPSLPPPWPPAELFAPGLARTPARLTDELRDELVRQAELGLPIGVICAAGGWPSRITIRVWRNRHPEFDQAVTAALARGCQRLADQVRAELRTVARAAGLPAARALRRARHSQLARSHPAHFAGGVWSRKAGAVEFSPRY